MYVLLWGIRSPFLSKAMGPDTPAKAPGYRAWTGGNTWGTFAEWFTEGRPLQNVSKPIDRTHCIIRVAVPKQLQI